MTLKRLELRHFRCIDEADLSLDERCTLIVGANGSGKTSILEAIYLLASGRSFRTHQTDLLISRGKESLLVVAHAAGLGSDDVLGMELSRSERRIRINGQNARSLAELAQMLPVQVIDPSAHRLMEDGPGGRRRFLDWGVFHVEPKFPGAWRQFNRALGQRNAALREPDASALTAWDQELAEHGEKVAELRDAYVTALRPFVSVLGQELLGADIDIDHQRGWSRDDQLLSTLGHARSRDQQRGLTSVGPHRAELVVKLGNLNAKDRISRGQQKLLACVLMLAQQRHRVSMGRPPACLLVDDPAAELDVDNLGKLLVSIAGTPAQLVITALSPDALERVNPNQMFHVKHGAVSKMA